MYVFYDIYEGEHFFNQYMKIWEKASNIIKN